MGRTPIANTGSAPPRRSARTESRLAGPLAGMYSTWLVPQERAVRARDAALEAGFGVNLLSDYCRSAPLAGLVVGFGGVTDAELDAALAVLVGALR